ncbi:unnamed protein product [Closterium sp. NIES-54]
MLLAPEGGLNAPDIATPRSYAEAITGPYSSQWQAAMDAEMASWKSTGTYVDAVPQSALLVQYLCWLTYLLIDLGEQPRSPPVLYVDNKAMIALCQEHIKEHRTKHIALRYFLARELHQRGQLRLAYVATRANTADIFTKALPPEAASLGASESTLPSTAPAEALHTFTLDSGASRCFFRDSTTLTPLSAPVPVRLADPSGGQVLVRSTTVLPCLAVAPPCSCRLLSHQTLLWHRRLGHPSLPRPCGMHSRLLVSGLPRSLPPLPPSPAPPCLPCVEGRLRAALYSYSFPPTTTPLQTLYMDVWGPSRVSGQGRERNLLLVVDDYTRYTTVFPLPSKGEVPDVLIPWIRAVRLQLRERFREDLPVLRLHSDRGGEFSSDLLQEFCRGVGTLQSFTLPPSPQQNGIAERRIGLVMEVARTSMIHAAAHPFLWPLAVRYAAH